MNCAPLSNPAVATTTKLKFFSLYFSVQIVGPNGRYLKVYFIVQICSYIQHRNNTYAPSLVAAETK